MQNLAPNELSFLVSNFAPPEDGFFRGYCFIGNDLVFGERGAKQYQIETGQSIAASQDGCYVTVRKDNESYVFDVDFSGYAVLYYYHDGRNWAVSNSFSRVVDFLRQNSLPVSPNYTHLAAANGRRMALGQLFSLETLANGIRVVPRTHSLVVSPNGTDLVRRPVNLSTFSSYSEALTNYMDTWISRFETLMVSKDADFTVSLSGGVDSRTNFALVQAALRRLGGGVQPPRLRSSGGEANRADLRAAKTIARHYGLEVNDKRELHRVHLDAEGSFRAYRELTLGVYFPFYRPTQAPTPMNITIGGGGGGIHRNTYELIYGSSDPAVFFKQNAKDLKRSEFEEEFIRDGRKFLSTTMESGEDPLRVLLREGRVRFHSGRTPRGEVSFTPLYSVAAEQVLALAGETRLERGQFNYDIMNSVDSDLANLPYDEAKKSPTASIKRCLENADYQSSPNPGRVWATMIPSNLPSTGDELWAYQSAFDKAVSNPFVSKFWGNDLVRTARGMMRTLSGGGSIGNPVKGVPISAILSADLVTPS